PNGRASSAPSSALFLGTRSDRFKKSAAFLYSPASVKATKLRTVSRGVRLLAPSASWRNIGSSTLYQAELSPSSAAITTGNSKPASRMSSKQDHHNQGTLLEGVE